MNLVMAHGAGLILGGLIVCWPAGTACRQLRRESVALQAEHVHRHDFQQARIRGTVRRVATAATLGFDWHVLVDEGTLLIGVALVTDGVSAGQGLQLANGGSPVRVMAVVALHQTFVHPVMERLGEIRFGGNMAAIAQLRLALNQQVLWLLGVMGRVAVEAADLAAGVGGLGKTRLLMAFTVGRLGSERCSPAATSPRT